MMMAGQRSCGATPAGKAVGGGSGGIEGVVQAFKAGVLLFAAIIE